MGTLADILTPETLQSLQELKEDLPERNVEVKEKESKNTADKLTTYLNDFFIKSEREVEVKPKVGYFDEYVGMSERVKRIVTEHFGSSLPVLHFTNAATGKNIESLLSTGFVEKFTEIGTKGKLHVGAFKKQEFPRGSFVDITLENSTLLEALEKARQIGIEFHHHGTRTNKNQLEESRDTKYSLPAVVVIDRPERLERGADNYDHWIVPSDQGPDKIVTIVTLNPEVASSRPLVKDKYAQNEFLISLIHGLGLYRLNQIHLKYLEGKQQEKEQLALYAHDLVDGYLVTKDEYRQLFDVDLLSSDTKEEINKRESTYDFYGNN